MAQFIDNFKDLEELGIDCDSNDNLTISFNQAANHLQSLLPNVDNQTLLTLYGYYKQGTVGPCNVPRPSWYDVKGKSKWESWKKLENMPQPEAKILYIDTIKKLDPNFDTEDFKSSKESWVKVSVPKFEQETTESEKTLTDYIREGNCDKVKEILKKSDAGKETLNTLDDEGLGVIHWAADHGSEDMLQLLINSDVDVNQQDRNGQTALHYASSCGHLGCLKLLLSNGARMDILDSDGLSPRSVAYDDNVKQLLST